MQYLKIKNRTAVLLFLACLLTGCQAENVATLSESVVERESPFSITRFDEATEWQEGEEIVFSQEAGQYVIEDGGNYKVTGQTSEGLIIDTEDQNVHLFLEDVSIATKAGPAIWVRSAGKVVITLVDGSNNILSDYPIAEGKEKAEAALYCVSDLTINGTGTLEVSGYYRDAIYSKDVLKILGGNIIVRSKKDGIRGSDGIVLTLANLYIESEAIGIRTANTGKAGKGSIDISGGSINIVAGEYGIKSTSDIYVDNAEITCQGVFADIHADGHKYITGGCIK